MWLYLLFVIDFRRGVCGMVNSVGYFSYCLGLCMVAFGFGDLLCFV